jgi:hypothetical protein
MEQAELAERAKMHINTVRRMEAAGAEPIAGRAVNVQAVQAALERTGLEFTNGGQPGVRLVPRVGDGQVRGATISSAVRIEAPISLR